MWIVDINIENCKHIFVTTNKDFVRAFNNYYKQNIERDTCQLLIDTNTLAAITWVKCKNVNENISELQLLEMAYSSQQPIPELIEKMSEILYKMEQEGKIDFDEAIAIRSDHFIKKEIMINSFNSPETVNEVLVSKIMNTYKERLIADTRKSLISNYEENKKQEKAAIIYRATKKAHDEAKTAKETKFKKINALIKFIEVIFVIISIWGLIISASQFDSIIYCIPYICLMIVTAISIIDTVLAKRLFISKTIDNYLNSYETKIFDKKYSEYMDLYEKNEK